MPLKDQLIKASNIFDGMKRPDYSYYLDEVLENVILNSSKEGGTKDAAVEASSETKTEGQIKEIFWNMYEVSDELENKGLYAEAKAIDGIRKKMMREFNGLLKDEG